MIYLRLMYERDLMKCLAIIKQNWISPRESRKPQIALTELNQAFTPDIWRPIFYVAVDSDFDEVCGLAGYHVSWLDYGIYDISWVNVAKDFQKSGVGKRLVQQCLDDISTLGHMAMLSTHIPDYFTKNFGFTTIGGYGDNMCLMAKSLEG